MDVIEADFVECLTNLRRVGEVEVKYLKASLIYDARNQITKYAADKGDFDYILWLDSDMTFEPDLMEKLIRDIEGEEDGVKKMAVTGLCFGRRPPFRPCIYKRLEVEQKGMLITPHSEPFYDYPRNRMFRVEACGFACVLTRMDMLEAMGIYGVPFFPVAGLGEDLTFCWRARKLDLEFWCDSRLKIGHIMRIHVDEAFRDQVLIGSGAEPGRPSGHKGRGRKGSTRLSR
jgi:GT2 family glycosyltransferase